MKALAFLATKKGLILAGVAAWLILRKPKSAAAAHGSDSVQGDGQIRVQVSSYYDAFVGGQRFCYEEGSDVDGNYFERAVPCSEADANGVIRSAAGEGGYGSVGLFNVRSG